MLQGTWPHLDRWVVCSRQAFSSIVTYWREEAGAGSLLEWRLKAGLIREAERGELGRQVALLAQQGTGHISVVFDPLDDGADVLLEQLMAHAGGSTLRALDWKEGPIGVLASMNAPDAALLEVLQQPAPATAGATTGAPAGYTAALSAWERETRESYPEAFARAYPAYAAAPAPWPALIALAQHSTTLPAAANDPGIYEHRFHSLAASSGRDARYVRLEPADGGAAPWTLSWAPLIGEPGGYLIFQARADAIPALVGRRIELVAGEHTHDLGFVQADGAAEHRTGGPVDFSDVTVRISRSDA